MADFAAHWAGFYFAIGVTIAMFILMVFGGSILDQVYERTLDLPGADSDFATASEDVTNWWINLFYAAPPILTLFAWGVWLQAVFKKDSSSQYRSW